MSALLKTIDDRADSPGVLVADRQRALLAEADEARLASAWPRRTRRTQIVGAILAFAVLFSTLWAAPAAAMSGPDFADGHGLYELESGELLTLFGRHPMLEFGGEEVHLVPDGRDRYVADSEPFDIVTFLRDPRGAVTGITFQRPGHPDQTADRVELYRERNVSFESGDVELAGSLFLPTTMGPHPAVAIVHGAEFGTRETYRLLASHFARRGVATLIYDKRGTGESAGSFATATFDDLTADALAAVSLLRADADIDPDRVGLAGMSQGGWIIAQAANQSDDVAFLVALSASGFTPAEQAAWLTGSMLAVRGFEQRAIDASARVWGMMYSSLDLIEAGLIEPMPSVPGFWFHALDPHLETGALWERVRQPVLGLWGEMDCQVPAHDSLAAVKAALERGPNRAYRLQILPGADHGMALAGACEREIGAHHGGRYQYASGYLDGPAEWIKSLEPESRGREVIVPAERADSLLGWHQSPDTTVPWFGSLAPQLAMPIALLVLFAAMAISASIGRALSIARGRAQPGASPTLLWGGAGLVGSLATLVGLVALVELLMLADLMSAPIIDGVAVDGISTVFAAAGFLAMATVIAVAAALIADARHGRLRAGRPAAGITALVGLVVWAGYWGFLPVPSFG